MQDRWVERARRNRAAYAASVIALATAPAALVLWQLPHQWRYVAPLVVVWILAVGALCVLFGAGKTLTAGAMAIGTAAAVGIPFNWIVHDYVQVRGTVTCASHDNVVGVFVRSAAGESGWAGWSATSVEYRARYKFTLHHRSSFRLGVGCGGTPQKWRADMVTPIVPAGERDFLCHDERRRGRVFGRCESRST